MWRLECSFACLSSEQIAFFHSAYDQHCYDEPALCETNIFIHDTLHHLQLIQSDFPNVIFMSKNTMQNQTLMIIFDTIKKGWLAISGNMLLSTLTNTGVIFLTNNAIDSFYAIGIGRIV